jgi:hypothetical protein
MVYLHAVFSSMAQLLLLIVLLLRRNPKNLRDFTALHISDASNAVTASAIINSDAFLTKR